MPKSLHIGSLRNPWRRETKKENGKRGAELDRSGHTVTATLEYRF
jgi:hypothetical protein